MLSNDLLQLIAAVTILKHFRRKEKQVMNFLHAKALKLRNNRFLNLIVVNLRYIIALGFIPSGMIKVVDKPFTRIENVGIFFDYLDALYTTGYYYNMIGMMQVLAAVLLLTQRYSTLGAFIFLPIIFNIAVLTISTIGSFTPIIATLMLLGIVFLLLWDHHKWINIFSSDNRLYEIPASNEFPTFQKVHIYTGISLLFVPALFFLLSFNTTAFVTVPAIIIIGNIISKMQNPVLRSLFKKAFFKPDLTRG